ncbi:MAG: hypothetical protein WC312_04920 [Candidatus Omnitrophota bacterium]|jgi:glycosyltransferase involved in cell wall biosynthesis
MQKNPLKFFPLLVSKRLKIFLTVIQDGYDPQSVPSAFSVIPRRENEVFVFRDTWYPEKVREYVESFKKIDTSNLIFLSNTEEIHEERKKHGMVSHFINIDCFLDSEVFNIMPGAAGRKKYDAVYNARFFVYAGKEIKRHFLTEGITNLALIDSYYNSWPTDYELRLRDKYIKRPNVAYYNKRVLPATAVADVLNQSRVGLILSELEGACKASGEYLLCGLPVVSTPSVGGRDIWYDNYNSIICNPTKEAVNNAVGHFLKNMPDPHKIRKRYLELAEKHEMRFINDVIGRLFEKYGIRSDPKEFFERNKNGIIKAWLCLYRDYLTIDQLNARGIKRDLVVWIAGRSRPKRWWIWGYFLHRLKMALLRAVSGH